MFTLLFIFLYILLSLVLSTLVMPLPINDDGAMRYGAMPWATIILLIVNVAVFTLWQAPDILRYIQATTTAAENAALVDVEAKFDYYGSAAATVRDATGIGAWVTFTGMFMHGSFSHLVGNMIFLWAFGRRVEDACGSWRFLLFYVFAGMVSKVAYYTLVDSDVGSVGASGAISGLMGAYMILFPGQRIRCLWVGLAPFRWIFVAITRVFGSDRFTNGFFISLPAILVLIAYLGTDLFATVETARTREMVGTTNYIAHAFGFFAAISIFLYVRKDLLARYLAGRRL